jgi:hypothetical protein
MSECWLSIIGLHILHRFKLNSITQHGLALAQHSTERLDVVRNKKWIDSLSLLLLQDQWKYSDCQYIE